jgi:AcrR family transcriptional regulator
MPVRVKGNARRKAAPVRDDARTRILETADRLFSRHGIHAVGIDRIIADAAVAKATLYHHFASKESLVLAFLEQREQRWTHDWLARESDRLAATPQGRALAVFDALDKWFRREDYEACSFINTLLETRDPDDPIRHGAVRHLDVIRKLLETYAEQAGAVNPRETGYQLQVLMMGAIVSACRGDRDAALRARALVELLLESSA